jgi:hypothetical protein
MDASSNVWIAVFTVVLELRADDRLERSQRREVWRARRQDDHRHAECKQQHPYLIGDRGRVAHLERRCVVHALGGIAASIDTPRACTSVEQPTQGLHCPTAKPRATGACVASRRASYRHQHDQRAMDARYRDRSRRVTAADLRADHRAHRGHLTASRLACI